jgi:glycerol-3-phosphate dehydrogenase
MIRDLNRLSSDSFDVAVIGGGIYGIAVTRELVARGARVALLERRDFGGATSFNSLKTVHGGIRALQHLSLAEMREFVRERRGLARIAPHLVRVLPFVVPTTRHPVRNRVVMRTFLATYDLLASDRNDGVDASRSLPPSRTVSREECLRLNPLIDPHGVTGGAMWHDYQLHSPERLAIALLQSAVDRGAAAANYIAAEALLRDGTTIRGVRVQDVESGLTLHVRARAVVNAAGPWAWPLLAHLDALPHSRPAPGLSLALNLVLRHPPLACAVGGLANGRFLFIVPWRTQSILGTSHSHYTGPPERVRVTRDDLHTLLQDATAAFPAAKIRAEDVTLVHRGLLPAPHGGRGTLLLKQSIVHDHAFDGMPGLFTVLGVRYTTARATAGAAAHQISRRLNIKSAGPEPTLEPVAGGDMPDIARYEEEASLSASSPAPLARRLISTYGTRHTAILRAIADDPSLGAALGPSCAITRSEVRHATREEMALHLSDVLLRRTAAGTGHHPGADVIAAAADIMSAELGWTMTERAREIEAVNRFYQLPDDCPGAVP